MLSRTFSLKALLFVMTACVIGLYAFLELRHAQHHWDSGLYNSEIVSAIVQTSDYHNTDSKTHNLTKSDSIRFLRLVESCPTREFDQAPTTYLPDPKGQDYCIVELQLTKNRKLFVHLMHDALMIDRDTRIDITPKEEKIRSILWPPK